MEPNEENLTSIFLQMENEGWDINSTLKWGFFFYSDLEENLMGVYSELVDHNYKIEHLHKNEGDEWALYISKVEPLASDKLHRRNIAFNELAEAYNSYYDGWDVGKA